MEMSHPATSCFYEAVARRVAN